MHVLAPASLDNLIARRETVYLTRQTLVECLVVSTRPQDRNGLGMTPAEAEAELGRLEAAFPVLPENDAAYAEWRRLVIRHGVTGVRSYDARLVGSMVAHGVTHILTFNVDDFR